MPRPGAQDLHELRVAQGVGIADPFVDDLSTGRGIVLGRAATKLRSIEIQPSTGGSTGQGLDGSLSRRGTSCPGEMGRVHVCRNSWPKTGWILDEEHEGMELVSMELHNLLIEIQQLEAFPAKDWLNPHGRVPPQKG